MMPHRRSSLSAAGLVALLASLPAAAAATLETRPLAPAGMLAPGFTRMPAAAAGIGFTNVLSDERSITNRNLLSGSGVALGDVDSDGRPDLLLCGADVPPALFRNLGGWTFADVSAAAFPGIDWRNPTSGSFDMTGAAFADVDGDGDVDLFLNALGGGTRLFRNDGQGRFVESTDAAGLRSRHGATSLALADVDGDGDLDLYVARFRPVTVLDQPNTRYQMRQTPQGPVIVAVNGRPITAPDLTNRFELGPGGDGAELGRSRGHNAVGDAAHLHGAEANTGADIRRNRGHAEGGEVEVIESVGHAAVIDRAAGGVADAGAVGQGQRKRLHRVRAVVAFDFQADTVAEAITDGADASEAFNEAHIGARTRGGGRGDNSAVRRGEGRGQAGRHAEGLADVVGEVCARASADINAADRLSLGQDRQRQHRGSHEGGSEVHALSPCWTPDG
jgi:hypothetical protein